VLPRAPVNDWPQLELPLEVPSPTPILVLKGRRSLSFGNDFNSQRLEVARLATRSQQSAFLIV
jgi:hypothetical protein